MAPQLPCPGARRRWVGCTAALYDSAFALLQAHPRRIPCSQAQALTRKLEVTGLPTVLLFCGSEGRVEQMQVR